MSPSATDATGTLRPILPAELARLEPIWRTLEAQGEGSFFTSWSWIGSWATTLAPHAELYLFTCGDPDQPQGLALLAPYRHRHRRLLPTHTLGLHQHRGGGFNMNIEYNGLLCRSGQLPQVASALLHELAHRRGPRWHELALDALTDSQWQTLRHLQHRSYWRHDDQHTPWIRPLAGLQSLDDLLAPLSRSRRWQIRRSMRHYEAEWGPLLCQPADDLPQALAWFDDMGVLHSRRWQRDGLPGSWANPNWVDFHRRVIHQGFPRGEIQLLHIQAGTHTLGYIYSFLWRGRVCMLQTGFAEPHHNLERPGYVGHCLAMLHNAQQSMDCYDFMCGDDDYKATLGQPDTPLHWVRSRRHSLRNRLEDRAIDLRRARRKARPPQ